MTYLDNSATSYPKAPGCGESMANYLQQEHGNPGRSHYDSANASAGILQNLRIKAASLFNIPDPLRIALVPSSTFALNTAILSCLAADARPGFIISPMEHNAVTRPLWMRKSSMQFPVIISGGKGMLMDPSILRQNIMRLQKQGRRVTVIVSLSSNITGHVNDISSISDLCHRMNCRMILDASQGAGNIDIDVKRLKRLDYMAVPGHKGLMGPQGTGLLYVCPNAPVTPIMVGGTGSGSFDTISSVMPDVLECGTMNTPGFAGLSAAIDYVASVGTQKLLTHKLDLCNFLSERLSGHHGIIPVTDTSLPNSGIFSFNITGMDSQQVAYVLAQNFGIAVRGGFHCSPLGHRYLGTTEVGAVRISPGPFTTEKEMQYAAESILHIASGMSGY